MIMSVLVSIKINANERIHLIPTHRHAGCWLASLAGIRRASGPG